MDKAHILAEIRRTAAENGSVPLGSRRFFAETGIAPTDWLGKHWARWGDALKEAGFPPNRLRSAYDDAFLLKCYAELARELGHFPVKAELQMKARRDPRFPSHNTFNRFGSRTALAARLLSYCNEQTGLEDVAALCASMSPRSEEQSSERAPTARIELGSVYLLRSGRYYKIGRSNAVGRRERELAIRLPEEAKLVHSIKTDDPGGIEQYWHKRFEAKRAHGEWFTLSVEDVAAFKRRKFM